MSQPPRLPLTRERIATAALALIDADGVDGCSMRRLGGRLGVEAMALYHHFGSKGELLDAVMDVLVQDIVVPPREAGPPLQRLRTALESYFEIARRHPRAFVLLATRRFNSPAALATYERILAAFADLGLDARQSACWFRLLGNYTSGSALADIASRELEPEATRLTLQHAADTIGLPHVAAVAPHLRAEQVDGIFREGLDLLFGLLAGITPPSAPSRSTPSAAPGRRIRSGTTRRP